MWPLRHYDSTDANGSSTLYARARFIFCLERAGTFLRIIGKQIDGIRKQTVDLLSRGCWTARSVSKALSGGRSPSSNSPWRAALLAGYEPCSRPEFWKSCCGLLNQWCQIAVH